MGTSIMQKSIEVEYWVIDENGKLTAPGSLVNTSSNVEEEFVDCLFELKTPPCKTIGELRHTFVEQLDRTIEEAATLGKRLVPLGTPINNGTIELLNDERTTIQQAVLGTNLDYAKSCAGTHIHFEQRNVVDQLNTLIALDPALALCNSSPYFQGKHIASSARAYLYRKRCYEHFAEHGQLWEYVDTVAEWDRKLEVCYEHFKDFASRQGVQSNQFERCFSPDTVVWTPVRLRDAMPTVEWRSPDATLPSQILRLAELIDSIMELIHNRRVSIGGDRFTITPTSVVLPDFDRLWNLSKAAMLAGLESEEVASYLRGLGADLDQFGPLTAEFDKDYVSRSEARSLRVKYADRLESDIDELVQIA